MNDVQQMSSGVVCNLVEFRSPLTIHMRLPPYQAICAAVLGSSKEISVAIARPVRSCQSRLKSPQSCIGKAIRDFVNSRRPIAEKLLPSLTSHVMASPACER